MLNASDQTTKIPASYRRLVAAHVRAGRYRVCDVPYRRTAKASGAGYEPTPTCTGFNLWTARARLTDSSDGDMGHVGLHLRPVPVVLSLLDMNYVAHRDLLFLVFVGNLTDTSGDDQDLVAGMGMPTGGCSPFEIDNAAAEVLAGSIGYQRLARAFDWAASPTFDGGGRVYGYDFNLCNSDNAHIRLLKKILILEPIHSLSYRRINPLIP